MNYNFSVPNPCDAKCLIDKLSEVNHAEYGQCIIRGSVVSVIGNHSEFSQTFNDAYQAAIDNYDHSVVKIASAINEKSIEIAAFRYSVIYGDFTYDGGVFDGDHASQEKITKIIETNNTIERLRVADPSIPEFTADWILKDNSIKTLVSSDIDAINLQIMQKMKDAYGVCFWHKAILFSKTTLSEIENYDFSASWPS